jgi:hypothetical protein
MFVMSPANDSALILRIANSGFSNGISPNTTKRFTGLPTLQRYDMVGTLGSIIPLLTYAPSNNSMANYAGFNAPIQFYGDVNVAGQLWQYGINASAILYSDTAFAALPNATTLFTKQVISPPSTPLVSLYVVTQTGTTGTPNSGLTTCTNNTTGASILLCTSATDLSPGQRISIGTDLNKQISYIDATNPSAVLVHMINSLSGTYSVATALTFFAPVLSSAITLPSSTSTTVNSQTCTLGSTCTIPFQTNGSGNTSQAGINLLTSTANSVGLTVTPTNSATNAEKFEVSGTYTGGYSASNINAGTIGASYLPAQYKIWSCQDGVGGGTAALATGTYATNQVCLNKSGVAWTITGSTCSVDAGTGTTVTITDGGGNNLLTSTLTCASGFATPVGPSSTTTIANGGYIKWTPNPDGTAKSITVIIYGTF